MKSIISEKGQVTIPKEVRDRHGLQPGVQIEFRSEGGAVTIIKIVPQDPLDKWRGRARTKSWISSDKYLKQVRDAHGD